MTKETESPWASGPGEILRHGLDLLRRDSDTNRRLAMISIDNSVELMIKTYLGLPKRLSGLEISRREYAEVSESFPALLDALEKYAAEKLDGVDLGTIEWYHRLRNELYHQGNGLTVERDKIEIYAALANQLFKNLYGYELVGRGDTGSELLGEFMAAWTDVEQSIRSLTGNQMAGTVMPRPVPLMRAMRDVEQMGLISLADIQELDGLRSIRNRVVHGMPGSESLLSRNSVDRVRHFAERLRSPKPPAYVRTARVSPRDRRGRALPKC
jgi:hypothetical protein